ncbi:MAG: mechanosensitive ion channel domain-containing protein [Planctomycetota bacterium]
MSEIDELLAEAEPVEEVTATPEAVQQTIAAELAEKVARERRRQVLASRDAVREVLEIGLSGDEVGELLREARLRAPDPDDVRRRVSERNRQLANVKLDLVRLLERQRLSDDPGEVLRIGDELVTQEAYLDALERTLAAETELANDASELVALLDSRLLWIGSAPAVGPDWLRQVGVGLRWITDPQGWIDTGQTLTRRVLQQPLVSVSILIFGGVLMLSRFKMKTRLRQLNENVGRLSTDSFFITLRVFMLTLLLSIAVPLLLMGVGGLLVTQSASRFASAVGQGLLAAGAVMLVFDFFRGMCRPGGLADAHFGWNSSARRNLLNNLGWLIVIEVPAAFVVRMCDTGGQQILQQGLGRLGFMIGTLALVVFIARVFRPSSGVFSELMSRDGWAWRLRRLWYMLIVLLPCVLTLAAALGYYYTATQVQNRFFQTGVIVLFGIVVYSMLTRWLLVTRRRLALQQARQRLAEQREAVARKGEAETAASGEAVPELDTKTIDVETASGQTISLLRTAVTVGVLAILWAVWGDLLPALRELGSFNVIDPTIDEQGETIVEAVTLWSLALGVVAVVLTVIAARNLPAVIELMVLQRFPLDAGARYAATTLTRYAVIAVGVVIASNFIGIDWSKAQWVVAALGVGLGFGLQEIVANFVSGLIILFERPVRVGDVVTVGDVSGTVSRLQIRATTITDWDNKEVLVPNKNFITDQVINWTLSSPVTRLLIPVGVAYGSDVAKAHAAISGAVTGVPAVLDEPAPSVLFIGFGDSSLDFEVRAFVSDLSKRLPTLHELHIAIDAALRSEGIEIPFPQRDLHLRSSDIGGFGSQASGQTVTGKK